MTDHHQSAAASSSASRLNLKLVLKISAVFWLIWGVAHIAFGVFGLAGFMSGDVANTMKAMAGGADPATLDVTYPAAVVAILNQHSWNLFWFGVFTTVGGLLIWRRNAAAILMTAIVGGSADMGYFAFVDLGGFAAPPGPQLTWICAAAIVMSMFVYIRSNRLISH